MTEYLVIIPIAGSISKIVEADSEKAAIAKAMDDEDWLGDIHTKNDWMLDDINRYEQIFEGNVSYIDISEAYAEEQEA